MLFLSEQLWKKKWLVIGGFTYIGADAENELIHAEMKVERKN